MIFATVGTHHHPFARFLTSLGPVADRTFLQYGHNPEPVGFHRSEAFVSFAEVVDAMETATAVVTHAGVGSILCARGAGHVPIVVPRLRRLGEHVDDHQLELTEALAAAGEVVVLGDGEPLAPLLEALPPRGERRDRPVESKLAAAVRSALDGGSDLAPPGAGHGAPSN